MRGGRRKGAGRPKGSKAKRHRVVVDEALLSGLMPIEWLLAVMRDPEAEQSRRDRAAEVAAGYLHARPAQVEAVVSRRNGGAVAGETIDVVQIFCIPRGGRITENGNVVVDGEVVGPTSVTPFEPSPPLELTDQRPAVRPPPEPPLPVLESEDDGKVESLSAWRRRSDGDEEPPAS